MCPRIATYVSSSLGTKCVSSYYDICVFILFVCPHTHTLRVNDIYLCPYTADATYEVANAAYEVATYLRYMCPYTADAAYEVETATYEVATYLRYICVLILHTLRMR